MKDLYTAYFAGNFSPKHQWGWYDGDKKNTYGDNNNDIEVSANDYANVLKN